MTNLVLLLGADIDIQATYERYEDFQEGRGEVFLHQLDLAFSLVRSHPLLGSHYGKTYRRMLVRDFPYGIFYEVQPTRVVVVAIMDLRQDPRAIQSRLYGS